MQVLHCFLEQLQMLMSFKREIVFLIFHQQKRKIYYSRVKCLMLVVLVVVFASTFSWFLSLLLKTAELISTKQKSSVEKLNTENATADKKIY